MFHLPYYLDEDDDEAAGPATPSTPCPNVMLYDHHSAASRVTMDVTTDFELPLERALAKAIVGLEDRLVQLRYSEALRRPKGLELMAYRPLGSGMHRELQAAQIAEWSPFHSLLVCGAGSRSRGRLRKRSDVGEAIPAPSPQHWGRREDAEEAALRAEADTARAASGSAQRTAPAAAPAAPPAAAPPAAASEPPQHRPPPSTPPRPGPAPPRTPGGGPHAPSRRGQSDASTDGDPAWCTMTPRVRQSPIARWQAPGVCESPFGGWEEETLAEEGSCVEVLAADAGAGIDLRMLAGDASDYLTAEEERRLQRRPTQAELQRATRAERRRQRREAELGLPPLSPRRCWRDSVVAACVQELWQGAVVPSLARLVPPQGVTPAPGALDRLPPSRTTSATTAGEASTCDLSVSQTVSVSGPSPSLGRGAAGSSLSRADSRVGGPPGNAAAQVAAQQQRRPHTAGPALSVGLAGNWGPPEPVPAVGAAPEAQAGRSCSLLSRSRREDIAQSQQGPPPPPPPPPPPKQQPSATVLVDVAPASPPPPTPPAGGFAPFASSRARGRHGSAGPSPVSEQVLQLQQPAAADPGTLTPPPDEWPSARVLTSAGVRSRQASPGIRPSPPCSPSDAVCIESPSGSAAEYAAAVLSERKGRRDRPGSGGAAAVPLLLTAQNLGLSRQSPQHPAEDPDPGVDLADAAPVAGRRTKHRNSRECERKGRSRGRRGRGRRRKPARLDECVIEQRRLLAGALSPHSGGGDPALATPTRIASTPPKQAFDAAAEELPFAVACPPSAPPHASSPQRASGRPSGNGSRWQQPHRPLLRLQPGDGAVTPPECDIDDWAPALAAAAAAVTASEAPTSAGGPRDLSTPQASACLPSLPLLPTFASPRMPPCDIVMETCVAVDNATRGSHVSSVPCASPTAALPVWPSVGGQQNGYETLFSDWGGPAGGDVAPTGRQSVASSAQSVASSSQRGGTQQSTSRNSGRGAPPQAMIVPRSVAMQAAAHHNRFTPRGEALHLPTILGGAPSAVSHPRFDWPARAQTAVPSHTRGRLRLASQFPHSGFHVTSASKQPANAAGQAQGAPPVSNGGSPACPAVPRDNAQPPPPPPPPQQRQQQQRRKMGTSSRGGDGGRRSAAPVPSDHRDQPQHGE